RFFNKVVDERRADKVITIGNQDLTLPQPQLKPSPKTCNTITCMKSSTSKFIPSSGKSLIIGALALAISSFYAGATLTLDLRAVAVNGVNLPGVSADANNNVNAFGSGAHTVTGLTVGDVLYSELFAVV